MTEWQKIFSAATKGTRSSSERRAAVRAAAQRYRGGTGRAGARRSRTRRNPSGNGWVTWLAIGGAALVAMNVLKGAQGPKP